MTIPSAGRIMQARTRVNRTLTGSCQIKRTTYTPDGMGGQTPTTTTLGPYACRVAPESRATEDIGAGVMGGNLHWRVTLPAGTDVQSDDVILFDGRELNVIAGIRERTIEILRRVVCAEAS